MDAETVGERFTRDLRRSLNARKRSMQRAEDLLLHNFNYLQGGSRSRLRTIRYHQQKDIRQIRKLIDYFSDEYAEDIYKAGLVNAGYNGFLPDPDFVRTYKAGIKAKGANAAGIASRQALAIDRLHHKKSSTVKQALRTGIIRPIPEINDYWPYGRRAHLTMGAYGDMVVRGEAQRLFNYGVIDGAAKIKDKKLLGFMCNDSWDCGTIEHDDPAKCDGEFFYPDTARKYVSGHPYCRRTFEPVFVGDRPDPGKDITDRGVRRNAAERWRTERQRRREYAAERRRIARREGSRRAGKAENVVRIAQALDPFVEVDWTNIAIDLVLDDQTRQVVFGSIVNGTQKLKQMQMNLTNMINRGKYNPEVPIPDEEEILDRMRYYIDELAAGNAVPEWVYNLLDVKTQKLVKVQQIGGPDKYLSLQDDVENVVSLSGYRQSHVMAKADDFSQFMNVKARMNATHTELNMLNSLENHYGDFFNARMQAAHPNLAGNLDELYSAVKRHYNEPVFRSGPSSAISLPRLGGNAYRGPRFRWSSRPVKLMSTGVNDLRHLNSHQLRGAMLLRGYDPLGHTRQSMIDVMGYKPGILSHITINPGGLFRMGLRVSPEGWIQPDFRIVPKTIPLRYNIRVNRGRIVDGYRIRSVTQEARIVTAQWTDIPLPNTSAYLNLGSIGIKTRTSLGRIDNVDDLSQLYRNYKAGTLDNQSLPHLRQALKFMVKGKYSFEEQKALRLTFNHIDKLPKSTVIRMLEEEGFGLTGWEMLRANTQVLNVFAEMRVLGYTRFDISRVFRISPSMVDEFMEYAEDYYGVNWRDHAMGAFMHYTGDQIVNRIRDGFNYQVAKVKQVTADAKTLAYDLRHNSERFWDDLKVFLGETFPRTFVGRAYDDFVALPDFLREFKTGLGAAIANRKYKTPRDAITALNKRAKFLARQVGYNLRAGSMLVAEILNDISVYTATKLGDADLLRRAVGKVITVSLNALRDSIVNVIKGLDQAIPYVTDGTRRRLEQLKRYLGFTVKEIEEQVGELVSFGRIKKIQDEIEDLGMDNVIDITEWLERDPDDFT